MQTILRILKQAGGWHHGLYLKIENQPYMALVIEAIYAKLDMKSLAQVALPWPGGAR
jgi:hypothetical protein